MSFYRFYYARDAYQTTGRVSIWSVSGYVWPGRCLATKAVVGVRSRIFVWRSTTSKEVLSYGRMPKEEEDIYETEMTSKETTETTETREG
jgi:hypothetical protein